MALTPLPPDPAESPTPEESAYADELAQLIRDFVARAKQGERAFRDAHAKILGVAKATVDVPADLSDDLAYGVFRPGASYKAWVRFSNGNSSPQSDGERDGRGMAIKLCDVAIPPEARLPDDTETASQDFVMIDNPVFFVRDAKDYLEFVRIKMAGKSMPEVRFCLPSLWPGSWHVKSLAIVLGLAKDPRSVLAQTFHSMTPYRLGPHVVKFSARPLGPVRPRTDESADSLRAALQAQLAADGARFALEVRRRGDTLLPVEDATASWNDVPAERVATITFAPQRIDSDAYRAFGDALSFSPWHGFMAHRPLGSLNRMRRAVYPESSTVRHDHNHTPPFEPDGTEDPDQAARAPAAAAAPAPP